MIYIFDKTQAIIKVLTNDDFTAAHLNFKINTATTFEFSLPASKALPSGSKYVATPHPLNDSKFIMLRLTERVDNTETIDYSAYELAYQELATDGYIEDKRPQNQSALNLMKIALNGSNWELNNVNVSGTATTNFYYVDRLSAISKVVDLLGGEIVFYIEIQGNAISGRYMDYLARQGADTSKVFASGSNLLTVERQSDTSGIYTAILPRGKGKEIDNGESDTPDGYGRRINIADVEWKKSAGKPLDKPKGSIVLSDPDATAEWGQINGNARLLLQTYDDIDDVNVLINSAYKTLQSVNHPQIQYSATVADVGGLSLGDTVLIMHGDRDLSYKTRVFEVKYDLLSPDQTELSLGDDLSPNSITSHINNLNAVADTTSSQTQWTINQIGRPSTTFGNTEPANPKVGDVFFKELPDGGTEIHRWNGNIWELLASPTTADDIAKAVNDAVSQAKSHTDEVKQGLSSDLNSSISQVKLTADGINNFVRDSNGNISSDFRTALGKTSIITGSTLATSIQKQTSSQISSTITDNNGKIISLINQDTSGVQIAGKNIVLNGDTTVTGDFYAKGGNFKNLNASNLTVGTLNGNQVNITNLNASNIVSGAISGANLNINLNTGQVQFQKGRIFKSDYTTDINIDQGYISTADSNTRVLLKSGQMQFVAPNVLDLQNTPYLKVYNGTGGNSFAGANLSGRDYIALYNSANVSNVFDAPLGEESFSGISTGQASTGKWAPTKVGGADRGVIISGGRNDGWLIVRRSPYIFVGSDANGTSAYGNRVYVHADYFHVPTVRSHGSSTGANVYVAADGALVKSSSATKYKTNIEHEIDSIQGDQLLTIDPATWNDKFESEQLERYHETGVEPERKINMEGKRYYGIIAEDLVKAGLEKLVTRNEETDEVEGVEYSKIGVALIPIIRDLRNKLNEQYVEIERLKEKIR